MYNANLHNNNNKLLPLDGDRIGDLIFLAVSKCVEEILIQEKEEPVLDHRAQVDDPGEVVGVRRDPWEKLKFILECCHRGGDSNDDVYDLQQGHVLRTIEGVTHVVPSQEALEAGED